MTIATELAAGWHYGVAKGAAIVATPGANVAFSGGTQPSAAVRTKFRLPTAVEAQANDVDALNGNVTITLAAPAAQVSGAQSADTKSRIHYNRTDDSANVVTIALASGNFDKSEVNPDAAAGGTVTLAVGGFITLEVKPDATVKIVGGASAGLGNV